MATGKTALRVPTSPSVGQLFTISATARTAQLIGWGRVLLQIAIDSLRGRVRARSARGRERLVGRSPSGAVVGVAEAKKSLTMHRRGRKRGQATFPATFLGVRDVVACIPGRAWSRSPLLPVSGPEGLFPIHTGAQVGFHGGEQVETRCSRRPVEDRSAPFPQLSIW